MKATKSETRVAIASAIRATRARMAGLTGDHPQVMAMHARNSGYLSALEDCASALDGDLVSLRTTAA